MAQVPKLRYIDPYERRGRLYLAICRFSTTKVGLWLAAKVAWRLDPLLLKLTRGRFSTTGRLHQRCSKREARGQVGRGEMPPSTSTMASA
jgi:hypothetical protein